MTKTMDEATARKYRLCIVAAESLPVPPETKVWAIAQIMEEIYQKYAEDATVEKLSKIATKKSVSLLRGSPGRK